MSSVNEREGIVRGRIRTILDFAALECREALKRPWLLITGILLPAFWLCVLASMFQTGLMRNLPVGLVDLDNSMTSRQIATALASVPSISFNRFDDSTQALEHLKAGRIHAYLVFPHDYAKKVQTGHSAIELHLSKSYYAVATILEIDIKTALNSILGQTVLRMAATTGGGFKGAAIRMQTIVPDVLVSGNGAFNFKSYLLSTLIPGVLALAVILTMVGVYTREAREGRFLNAFAEGTDVLAKWLGKSLPWACVYTLYALAYISWFAGWSGNVPIGSLSVWTLGALLLIASMFSVALMLVTLSPSWLIAMSVAIGYCAPIFPFTGFSFPLDSMGSVLQIFSTLFPLTWFIQLQSAHWVLGSTAAYTLNALCHLLLFTLVPLVVASIAMPWRLRKWKAEAQAQDKETLPDVGTGFLRNAAEGIRRGICRYDTVVIFLFAIAFYLVFYAWPYMHQTVTSVRCAIVNLDQSETSLDLERKIASSSSISLVASLTDPLNAKNLFRNDTVSAVIEIPKHFERDLLANKPTHVSLKTNGVYTVKARAVQASLLTILQEESSMAAARNLVLAGADATLMKAQALREPALVTENHFNTISGYATYILSAVSPIILQSVLLMAICMSFGLWLGRKKHDPYLEHVLTDARGFASMMFGYGIFAFLWFAYAEGLDFSLFNFPSLVNLPGTLLVMVLYCAAVVTMGTTIALALGEHAYAAQLLILISAPAVFLSGAIYPSSDFGTLPLIVRLFLPSTPGIPAMVAVSQNGASLRLLEPELLHLALLIVGYAALAGHLRRRTARDRGLLR